ncbi:MAG TPA: efflux RND transporter periplasmic adaptor subunit [Flavobacterium sp.]|uniref:efflux RND transporter periplasmic adaptor subunit n=1 Tax=unclassified Flavobacterium TaxID=196869 RepID=UPI000E9CD70B|nr:MULTISPECIES: efflux RND transporter periplasmic adaptor subunit [unclassified Flavobacterium]HBI01808.1 RND transporter [Flavobacterium sp.]HRE77551.1 efflux RND transporter periplasmic adaptor subunit [Flavobacterium sp.]
MDTIVPRKNRKNKYILIASVVFLLLTVLVVMSMTKKRSLDVSSSEVSIKSVMVENFEDYIVFQAKVEPLNSMLINVIEGGSIQEIFVENGDFVEKGQPLARLYNPNTELSFMNQETAMIEQINNLNKAKLDLRTQELNLAKDLISIEHDYFDAKNLYDLNQKLYKQEILSKNEWETTQENFRYQTERKNIIQQSVQKEKKDNQILIAQINQSQGIMQKSLQILRENKKNFLVVASLAGRLSSFEPVLGKNYSAGETIGKIDVMKGYKLMADVDEFYLEKVSEGQKANIEYKEKIISVIVSKVIPEVKNGRFQVELQFANNKELDLRQGLSFGVRLLLSEKTKSTVIPKGSFYQETAGKWIFVVNGDKAERREIKLGRENPLYYEVLSGLKVGEKVITSGYKDYAEVEVLNLNKN